MARGEAGLDDAECPLDNNPAEAALRRVALGRKNFLFVGNDDAGNNLAGLYSLVATCEANQVNPTAYLTDVLVRIHEHPNSRIDELLPHNWTGPPHDEQWVRRSTSHATSSPTVLPPSRERCATGRPS